MIEIAWAYSSGDTATLRRPTHGTPDDMWRNSGLNLTTYDTFRIIYETNT
jgi:hypothetical protein